MDVNYKYPLKFAKIASRIKVPYFGLLSARWANPKENSFYLRTKGKTEDSIEKLNLTNLNLFRAMKNYPADKLGYTMFRHAI
mgnify:CR=1 FL=1